MHNGSYCSSSVLQDLLGHFTEQSRQINYMLTNKEKQTAGHAFRLLASILITYNRDYKRGACGFDALREVITCALRFQVLINVIWNEFKF